MKQILMLLLLLMSIITRAQNNAVLVSMMGIGDIKVGMKKSELEKLLNQPLKTPHLLKKEDEHYYDTVHVSYKGVEADVVFQKEYAEDKKFDITVWEVRSATAGLKTRSGISIGDDKLKIVSTYPDFMLQIMPEYENEYKTKSKIKSTVWLIGDESGTVIIFYLTNNKVTGFSVIYSEGC